MGGITAMARRDHAGLGTASIMRFAVLLLLLAGASLADTDPFDRMLDNVIAAPCYKVCAAHLRTMPDA